MSISSRHSLCSLAAAHVTYFERFERRTLVCCEVDQTPKDYHIRCGREARRAALREQKNKLRKKFLSAVYSLQVCGRCDAVSDIAWHEAAANCRAWSRPHRRTWMCEVKSRCCRGRRSASPEKTKSPL